MVLPNKTDCLHLPIYNLLLHLQPLTTVYMSTYPESGPWGIDNDSLPLYSKAAKYRIDTTMRHLNLLEGGRDVGVDLMKVS
mmetsp:Transcript_61283/g.101618  ORF Transcript_61283/g.101618 Transcript_61283/m.101618 type:complete len:81 (+) Transcript_61283:23-265(+)